MRSGLLSQGSGIKPGHKSGRGPSPQQENVEHSQAAPFGNALVDTNAPILRVPTIRRVVFGDEGLAKSSMASSYSLGFDQ